MANLTAAIIGCGGMAKRHLIGYLRSKRYDIIALADLHEAAMQEFDDEFNIKTNHYSDAREMMEKERPDVVSIGTWHSGHAEWTIAASAYKPKAILCEKPMADTPGRAEQMLVACQRNGVKLAIGHQRRFLPAYTKAKDLIAEGAIGNIEWVNSLGGQGLPNYCTHQTDMFRYLLGDEECVWVMGNIERKTDRYERDTRIEDAALAVYMFESGAKASILCDLTDSWYQGAKVYGSEGMIHVTTTELQILNSSTSGWQKHVPEPQYAEMSERQFEYLEAGSAQAVELADWVEGRTDSHRGDAVNGFKALQMIHAVYESARCHEKVIMPLQTRVNPLDVMVESGDLPVERPGKYEIRASRLRGEGMESDTEAQ